MAAGPEPHRQVHSEVPVTSRSVFPKTAVPVLESFSVVHCSSRLPWWLRGRRICLQCRRPGFNPWVGKIPWRRERLPTPVFWPGGFHGQRSLVGCSPWGRKESDMTEQLHFHFSLSCIGEGNGNPLQCSCLENPRDGGAWSAVYGVTQSWTRLK